MLSAMFSGRIPARLDVEWRFFIDRDGRHFHHILNYLRDGKFPSVLTPVEREEVALEASFYGLEAFAAHLRAVLRSSSITLANGSGPSDGEPAGSTTRGCRSVAAAEAADAVLNRCLEDWPEFPEYVSGVLDRLLQAGGVPAIERDMPHDPSAGLEGSPSLRPAAPPGQVPGSGVLFDEASAASLQTDTLAAVQIELAHVDDHSKAWRWSDRRTGVNSALRAKLLRCHLQRLGYACRIVSVHDKRDIAAYVLQVELPIPP